MVRDFVRILILVLAALAWAPVAGAQTLPPGQVPAQELDATRHRQPTQAEVDQREQARNGNDEAARRRAARDQATVDLLYRQLTGHAPNAAPQSSGSSTGK